MAETAGRGTDFRILTAGEVDGERLGAFLERFYGPVKGAWLRRHGDWLHRGEENRLVMVSAAGEIAAYCAVLPTLCALGSETLRAWWWIDLVVAPEHRGRGLQTLLDRRVRESGRLVLGFPNQLAAKIHRRHGWGVSENHRVLIRIFDPTELRRVREARGARGALVRLAARGLRPLAALDRRRCLRYEPRTARRLAEPDSGLLAGVFERRRPVATLTTLRDDAYLRWRYLEAPDRADLGFYVAGPRDKPSVAAVTRRVERAGIRAARLLDLFGDLEDLATVGDLLRLVARGAAASGAVQLTAFLSEPRLRPAFRSAGLRLGTVGRFCWYADDRALMRRIADSRRHWCLGDSDHDAPI